MRSAHLVMARESWVSLGRCLLIQRYFCAVYYYGVKADLSKGYWNPKRISALFLNDNQFSIWEKSCHTLLCVDFNTPGYKLCKRTSVLGDVNNNWMETIRGLEFLDNYQGACGIFRLTIASFGCLIEGLLENYPLHSKN